MHKIYSFVYIQQHIIVILKNTDTIKMLQLR